MTDNEKLKDIVREKYGQIARRADEASDCSCGCCGGEPQEFTVSDEYRGLDGYVPEADLGLGCGLPTIYADIKPGDTVVDLGSGAGNDAFVARSIVGEAGRVIGIDMTREMIDQARRNNEKLGFGNVEFRLGDIEALPVEENTADVVVSNCVLNLVPDKAKGFAEIHRILKPGAHFCISDIVIKGELPEKVKNFAELYAGCVAGALPQEEYIDTIKKSGFKSVEIKTSKEIHVPDSVLEAYFTRDEIDALRKSGSAVLSITVLGYK